MRRTLIVLLVLLCACSPAEPSAVPTDESTPEYGGLDVDALGAFHAVFDLTFDGDYAWRYRLETRSDGSVVEYQLHLEGVSAERNPGDVRVVVDGDTLRMRGPGTGDECWQSPSDGETGLTFLTPDDLIDPAGFQEPLELEGADVVAGAETNHYIVRQSQLDDWADAVVDLWLDGATGALMRYDLSVSGPDPLFDAGEGTLSGSFVVQEVGAQQIEAVAGCEIDLPLSEDATRIALLPGGLVVFESALTVDEMIAFYQTALPEAGWVADAEPQVAAGGAQLEYTRGEATLGVSIEVYDGGTRVALWPDGS